MSKEGLKIAADAILGLQVAREKLLRMGTPFRGLMRGATPTHIQDVLLGQLMGTANDAIKDRFCELSLMTDIIGRKTQ